MWIYLTLLKWALKVAKMEILMLCLFCHNLKNSLILVSLGWIHVKVLFLPLGGGQWGSPWSRWHARCPCVHLRPLLFLHVCSPSSRMGTPRASSFAPLSFPSWMLASSLEEKGSEIQASRGWRSQEIKSLRRQRWRPSCIDWENIAREAHWWFNDSGNAWAWAWAHSGWDLLASKMRTAWWLAEAYTKIIHIGFLSS